MEDSWDILEPRAKNSNLDPWELFFFFNFCPSFKSVLGSSISHCYFAFLISTYKITFLLQQHMNTSLSSNGQRTSLK